MKAGTMVRSSPSYEPVDRYFQFSLLGMLASGFLALAGSGSVGWPVLLLAASAIAARTALVSTRREFPVGDGWIAGLTAIYILFLPVDYFLITRSFIDVTVHLVLFLAVVKVLTARTDRDYFYVIVVALLELLAASLLSSRLNYFFFLALFLLFGVSTFASWEIRRACGRHRRVVRRSPAALGWRLSSLAAATTLGVLIVTTGLFFVLPRTARAAFERLVSERYHLTAFSDEVTIGEIGDIKRQNTPVMHVRIEGVDGMMHLKWRGGALASFDGRRWFNRDRGGQRLAGDGRLIQIVSDAHRRLPGRRLDYEVQLKSFATGTLFIAGKPEFIRINAPRLTRSREEEYRTALRPASGLLRYGVYALLENGPPPAGYRPRPLSKAERTRYLQLPPTDPRIAPLARRVTAGARGDDDRARAIEQYLRSAYQYTLELPQVPESDPVAQFLFDRRKGHCEYFASAMAVMLRSLGIPSRVATGFQSGVYNPISGWILIRASDAHSWVEAWLPDRGWTTFDPTPAGPAQATAGLFSQFDLFLDAADTFWQDWVISYNFDRQVTLAARISRAARRFSFGSPDVVWRWWRDFRAAASARLARFGWGLPAGLVAAMLLFFALRRGRRWWAGRERARRLERGGAVASDATVLYRRALGLLERRGMRKSASETPLEFARQVRPPGAAAALARLTAAYNELRFGERRDAAPRLLALLGELERTVDST